MPINAALSEGYLVVTCGVHIQPSCTLMYKYSVQDGCEYYVYDKAGACLQESHFDKKSATGTNGGGFTIDSNMSRIKFSRRVDLYSTSETTVEEIIKGVDSLEELRQRLEARHVDVAYTQDIINIYLDSRDYGGSGGGAMPPLEAYPVGAVYTSSLDIDPIELFGGVWEPLVGIFHDSIFAWVRAEDIQIAVADMAIADIAVCA